MTGLLFAQKFANVRETTAMWSTKTRTLFALLTLMTALVQGFSVVVLISCVWYKEARRVCSASRRLAIVAIHTRCLFCAFEL